MKRLLLAACTIAALMCLLLFLKRENPIFNGGTTSDLNPKENGDNLHSNVASSDKTTHPVKNYEPPAKREITEFVSSTPSSNPTEIAVPTPTPALIQTSQPVAEHVLDPGIPPPDNVAFSETKKIGFSGEVAASGGLEIMGSSNVLTRKLGALDLTAFASVRYAGFAIGPYCGYRYSPQLDSPSQVSNQNLSGTQYDIGVFGQYQIAKIGVRLGYELFGKYSLNKNTQYDQSETLNNPTGYMVQVGYNFERHFQMFFKYHYLSYGQGKVGNQVVDLSNGPINSQFFGVGILVNLGILYDKK